MNSVNRNTEKKNLNWSLLEMKNSVSKFKKCQWKTSPTEGLCRRQNIMLENKAEELNHAIKKG